MPTILIVDDEPMVRTILIRTLRGSGFRTVEAMDGNEALAVIRQTPDVDLVLSDVVMPVMNGVALREAAAAIRPELPFLFMSGHVGDHELVGSLITRGYTVLPKPFSPDRIPAEVGRALRAGARRT